MKEITPEMGQKCQNSEFPQSSLEFPEFPRISGGEEAFTQLSTIEAKFFILDYEIGFALQNWFQIFLGYVVSCIVAKHTMWIRDCITLSFLN